jgi:hypothetical protein
MIPAAIDENAARETFEKFLFDMDERIEGLRAAAAARDFDLDLSLESLSALEAFVQETLSLTPPPIDQESLIVAAGRYLGEVVRERFGGKWDLPLSDRKNINFNQPVVVGHAPDGVEMAPLSVMRAFVKKKQPGLLARAVAGQVSPKNLDLSELIQKEKDGNR